MIESEIIVLITQLIQKVNAIDKYTTEDLSRWNLLDERIRKLENYMEMEDRITASHVLIRLNELENNYQSIKKPHKCPVCDGKGRIQSTQSCPPYVLHDNCHSCEGTGIIWG